ncbi:TMEM175 family protein [Methanoculleus frigidifontis]|uniref:TMEM175 family protein n=1 Tax=Methanoculleus frigidifontis TaxID=2584085 RepID=UPI002659FD04|nr:TMEM175 family protein [Methanoculleus sp. FWC-SCC1]
MASRSDDSPKRSGENRLTAFLPADRLRAFADGVFAIVITLLVLELPVPEATDDLLWALLEAWPDFLAYVISFVFIGGFWITHSSITRLTEHEDGVTFRMTLVMLFFVSLLPFSTSLMVKHLVGPGSRLSVFIYGLDLLFASFMLDRIMRYLARRPELLVDGLAVDDHRPRKIGREAPERVSGRRDALHEAGRRCRISRSSRAATPAGRPGPP